MLVLLNYVWADAMIEKERTTKCGGWVCAQCKDHLMLKYQRLVLWCPFVAWWWWLREQLEFLVCLVCSNQHVNLNRNRLHTNYIVYERTCEPWWKTNYTQNVKAMDCNWNATCGWRLPSTSCSVWKHVFEIAITVCTVLWFPPHILMTCV